MTHGEHFVTERSHSGGSKTEPSPRAGAVRSYSHSNEGTQKGETALHPAVRDLMRSMAAVAMCIVLAHLLAGCGGGDPEPDVLLPTVSCTAGACK